MSTPTNPANSPDSTDTNKPLGVYRPESQRPIGSYSSEVNELSNIANSNAFSVMNESLRVDGGIYLAFSRISDKETFNANFAINFSTQAQALISTLESQVSSSSVLDQIREDISLINELIADHIDAQNATPDMFSEIDNFLTSHSSDLSASVAFKLKSMAVAALEDTYNTIDGAITNNSFDYLSNLPSSDQDKINKFLNDLGLENFQSMTNNSSLIDTLASIVTNAGIDGLRDVYDQVKVLYAEQDPAFAAKSRKYNDALSAMRIQLDEYTKQTDKAEQAKIRAALTSSISSFNSLFPSTTSLDINDLIDFSASTNINAAETTAQKALQLDSSVGFPQLESLYNQLQAEAYPSSGPIDQTRLKAAIDAMEKASPLFVKSHFFIETQTPKTHYTPSNIWEALSIKNPPKDFDALKGIIARDTFTNHADLQSHIKKLKAQYSITVTEDQLLGGSDFDSYDKDNVNVEEIIGLNPGVNFVTAEAQFRNITSSLSGPFNPTTFQSALSLFNSSVQSSVDKNLFVEEVTTPRMKVAFPDNEFKILGVNVADRTDLQKKLTPTPGEDVTTYVSRCAGFGVAFDPDVISAPKIEFNPIDSRINKGLDSTNTVVNLTPDQAAIALMGVSNSVHALNLDNPVQLSPEASLKSGVVSFVSNRIRNEFNNIRMQFQTQDLNLEEIRRTQGRNKVKQFESQIYSLDYKEAMLSLALDLASASNTNLKKSLEILSDDFSIEDFESQAVNLTDQQILTVCAELNSFAEGTRRSSKHENRKIMFRSNQDIAQVKRFNRFALDFIQKRMITNSIDSYNSRTNNSSQINKLKFISSLAHNKLNQIHDIVDKAYTGSKKDASYRFMLGVKQELREADKKIRGFKTPWSLDRGFKSGYDSHQKLKSHSETHGFSHLTQHGNLISPYGRMLTTVSDLLTSPLWLTRREFRPSLNKIKRAGSFGWNATKWTASAPFKALKFTSNKAAKFAGWTIAAPIRIPVNIVRGFWSGAVGA